MQYPKTMQASHARWEKAPDLEADLTKAMLNGSLNDHEPDAEDLPGPDAQAASIFTPVKPIHSRHFLVVDTLYENPMSSQLGVPGPDGDAHDIGFNGLASIPDDIRNELPAECRKAFDEALAKELNWKTKWGTESKDSMRKAPIIDKGLINMQ
jgi:chromatin structure-remodeling complex protein RSC7